MEPILKEQAWEAAFSGMAEELGGVPGCGTAHKILITSDLYLPSVNGVVTSVLNLVTELRKLGYEVRILTTSYDNQYHYDAEGQVYYMKSIPCKVYPGVRMPINYFHHEYLDELIAWKPDVIHSQCEFFSFQYAKKIAEETDALLVHTYHTLYGQYASYLPIHAGADRMIAIASQLRLEIVNTVIAPTNKVKEALLEYGVRSPIAVIPTGISLDKFRVPVDEVATAALREQYGLDGCHVLLSLGRIGKEKNIEELIRYFETLLRRRSALSRSSIPPVKFLIVGGGPDMERLKELTESLGLSENVIFTGMVKPDEVRQYYALGDIFVCASTSETQGLTYVEALACGLPLVCRSDPALDGVVTPGINGYRYENAGEFCTYISRILDTPPLSRAMRNENLRNAENFSKERFALNAAELYNTLYAEKYPAVQLI
ncbi:MAG: glycosyltransferase [Clostridia bacterium]|nr:glycosyltransferase [Clostridia bacterium]